MARPSRRLWLGLGLTAAAGLAALLVARELNAPTYGVAQAPRADALACARIAKGYPATLGGHRLAGTDVPGVAVWGDKAVVLRCGLQPPAPTTDLCVTVNSVDWVYRQSESRDGRKVIITYGRDPAVEVTFNAQDTAVDSALVELSRIVRPIHQSNHCIDSAGS
ncbi:DUF3515 family protein [Streptomyces sp. NPDC087294]|uniref:DUF3515 family protein n=1 Tax=Streptomyces sp. NPDC087294 TaxID=3365777 RepID=UPI00382F487D